MRDSFVAKEAIMSVQARPYTYNDLLQTPDDGNRYEIIDGVLLLAPAPNLDHQDISLALTRIVDAYVRRHRLGRMYYAPVDVRLSPHDIVEPDLLFIRRDRLDIIDSRKYVMGPPDLAVEIISPTSRKIDQERKFALYARSGVPEYWLLDGVNRSLRMFRLDGDRYVAVEPTEGRLESTVIPGLVLDPAALFAEIDDLVSE